MKHPVSWRSLFRVPNGYHNPPNGLYVYQPQQLNAAVAASQTPRSCFFVLNARHYSLFDLLLALPYLESCLVCLQGAAAHERFYRTMKLTLATLFLTTWISTTHAWGDGSYYNSGSGSYSDNSNDNSDSTYSSNGYQRFGGQGFFSDSYSTKVIAHAVLATIAFGFLFPAGGILIRLASFRGLWIIHGIWQLLAYALYIAAFALGVYLVRKGPRNMLHDPHPIIGIILLGLLFFQPFFGLVHHFKFKKHLRRTLWSYLHLWIGRIVVTLGIINGGLGLRLARRMPFERPSDGAIIGYGVAAGFMWLLYVLSAVIGERRRSRVRTEAAGQNATNQKAYASSRTSSNANEGRDA
ncbi:hypothetical protein BST61_g4777 [Cercospora zeina]